MTSLVKPEPPKAGLPAARAVMDAGEYMPSSPDDYAMPVLKLAQHNEGSVAGAAAGKFYSAQTQQVWDSFTGIVLRVQEGRTMFPPDGTLAAPICSSDDNIMPRAGMAYPGPCGRCPMRADSPGSMAAAERRRWCLKTYSVLVLEKETGQPFIHRVKGTGIGPLKDWNSVVMGKYHFRPFAIETEFRVEARSGPPAYFVARPVAKRVLDEQEIAGYEARAREFIGVRLEAADEDEGEEQEAPATDVGGYTPPPAAPSTETVKTARIRLIADPEMQYAPITMKAWTRMTGRVLNADLSEIPNVGAVNLEAWDAEAEAWNREAQKGDVIWVEGVWKRGFVEGKLFRVFVVQNEPHILARAPQAEAAPAAPVQKSLDDLPF